MTTDHERAGAGAVEALTDPLDRLAAHHPAVAHRVEAAEALSRLLAAVDRGDLTASPPLRHALAGAHAALAAQPWHRPRGDTRTGDSGAHGPTASPQRR